MGEHLEPHQKQARDYATEMGGVKYSGLTDGNRWIVEDLERRILGQEDKILDVTISQQQAHQCALKLLLLWHPTLSVGKPAMANQPVLVTIPETSPPIEIPDENQSSGQSVEGWVSLANYKFSDAVNPPNIRLPDNREVELERWYGILLETAEWLVRSGDLTASTCPIPNKTGGVLVNTVPNEISGRPIATYCKLTNGLFLKTHGNLHSYLSSAKILLGRCAQDPASILLKPSQ